MMDHAERSALARALCARMISTYPGEVILGGVYGSTARRCDTPWSDLEMFFVVADGCRAAGQHLLYRGTAVGYRVLEHHALEELLTNPSHRWPFHMGVLSELEVLHGDPAQVQSWLALGRSVPWERFKAALEECLPELVVEAHGRIHSCYLRKNHQDMLPAVCELLFEMKHALCLLNRSWVRHDYYQGLLDAFQFAKLPEGFAELVPALWTARDPGRIVSLADELVDRFGRLLLEEGVQQVVCQSIEEVAV